MGCEVDRAELKQVGLSRYRKVGLWGSKIHHRPVLRFKCIDCCNFWHFARSLVIQWHLSGNAVRHRKKISVKETEAKLRFSARCGHGADRASFGAGFISLQPHHGMVVPSFACGARPHRAVLNVISWHGPVGQCFARSHKAVGRFFGCEDLSIPRFEESELCRIRALDT